MTYRDGTMEPPNCPVCKQPAVTRDLMFGLLYCPELHEFDWPRSFDGRGLPGLSGLRPCVCGSSNWRFITRPVPRPWWRRLLFEPELECVLACKCGKTFEHR